MRTRVLISFLWITCVVLAQNPKKNFKTGMDFYEAGHYQDAVNQFNEAIRLSPQFAEAYVARGDAYEQLKDYQLAAEDFQRAVVFLPRKAEVITRLGRAYRLLGKDQEAFETLNRATKVSRVYLPAYQEKVLVMVNLGDYFNALKVSDSTLALKDYALNYQLHGMVLEKLNSKDKALWAYDRAIRKDKKFIDAYISLAALQTELGKTDEALQNCAEALKLDPQSRAAYLTRSKIHLNRMDFPSAINDISRIIAINQNDEELFFVRGTYYQDFSQHQNAINDFNKVLMLNKQNAEAYYRRALSYEEVANFKAAISDYEHLLRLSEFDARAQKLLKEGKDRLFHLNRENEKPEIVLLDPIPTDKHFLEIPQNRKDYTLKGIVKDQSEISFLSVNDTRIPLEMKEGTNEFTATVDISASDVIHLVAADVYDNIQRVSFNIKRTEINPPRVSLLAPYASDTREVYIDSQDGNLYIEGRIVDESLIQTILIEGISASFPLSDLNPGFNATINIANKDKFVVRAIDIYGNETIATYTINRDGATLAQTNPMGKTWVIFIENSNYQTFASIDGPGKDVSLMRAALAKYQVHNIIHKKDMSKEQLEKFFSIELRDLVRSNRVNSLMLWYAGHGKFISETGYWIPVDARRDDEFTYFNINSLKASMQSYSTSVTHTLVVSDACESGPSFYQAMRSTPKERSCDDWQATRFRSSQVLSSAGYELAVDNSQFTRTFASSLVNNPNACIPIESIVDKVTVAVTKNNQQKPKFGKIAGLEDEDGTFFFIAKPRE